MSGLESWQHTVCNQPIVSFGETSSCMNEGFLETPVGVVCFEHWCKVTESREDFKPTHWLERDNTEPAEDTCSVMLTYRGHVAVEGDSNGEGLQRCRNRAVYSTADRPGLCPLHHDGRDRTTRLLNRRVPDCASCAERATYMIQPSGGTGGTGDTCDTEVGDTFVFLCKKHKDQSRFNMSYTTFGADSYESSGQDSDWSESDQSDWSDDS